VPTSKQKETGHFRVACFFVWLRKWARVRQVSEFQARTLKFWGERRRTVFKPAYLSPWRLSPWAGGHLLLPPLPHLHHWD